MGVREQGLSSSGLAGLEDGADGVVEVIGQAFGVAMAAVGFDVIGDSDGGVEQAGRGVEAGQCVVKGGDGFGPRVAGRRRGVG